MVTKEQVRGFQKGFPGSVAEVLNDLFNEATIRWNQVMMDASVSGERLRQAQGALILINELDESIRKTMDMDTSDRDEIAKEEDEDGEPADVGY